MRREIEEKRRGSPLCLEKERLRREREKEKERERHCEREGEKGGENIRPLMRTYTHVRGDKRERRGGVKERRKEGTGRDASL